MIILLNLLRKQRFWLIFLENILFYLYLPNLGFVLLISIEVMRLWDYEVMRSFAVGTGLSKKKIIGSF